VSIPTLTCDRCQTPVAAATQFAQFPGAFCPLCVDGILHAITPSPLARLDPRRNSGWDEEADKTFVYRCIGLAENVEVEAAWTKGRLDRFAGLPFSVPRSFRTWSAALLSVPASYRPCLWIFQWVSPCQHTSWHGHIHPGRQERERKVL